MCILLNLLNLEGEYPSSCNARYYVIVSTVKDSGFQYIFRFCLLSLQPLQHCGNYICRNVNRLDDS